jgi:hypothetical protein
MKTKTILFLSILMLVFACKNTKKSQKTTEADIYRVIVSFNGKGEGTDKQAIAKLESYTITFGKKEGKTLAYDKYPYGREGEIDYCFYLKELKKGAQDDFVAGLKNLMKDAKYVFIKENEACKYKK